MAPVSSFQIAFKLFAGKKRVCFNKKSRESYPEKEILLITVLRHESQEGSISKSGV